MSGEVRPDVVRTEERTVLNFSTVRSSLRDTSCTKERTVLKFSTVRPRVRGPVRSRGRTVLKFSTVRPLCQMLFSTVHPPPLLACPKNAGGVLHEFITPDPVNLILAVRAVDESGQRCLRARALWRDQGLYISG